MLFEERWGESSMSLPPTQHAAVPFSKGSPVLGTWQGIFLMEFDGPRERKVFITLVE